MKGANKMDAYEVKKETENSYNLGKIRQAIKSSKYFYNNENKRYYDISKFEGNKLSISPQGGGFVGSLDITNQSFIKRFLDNKIEFTNQMPFVWKKVKLFHDHWLSDKTDENGIATIEHYIEGYVTEHKWNGWSIPMVELDQIEKFNKIQKKTLDSEPSSIFKIIDNDSIQIKMFDEEDWTTIEFSLIPVNNEVFKVFDISLGWTWSEEDL
tara:strand:- start:642 stop:1274 length:633 start_codon:yes stop_codon:yes gene_type:complete